MPSLKPFFYLLNTVLKCCMRPDPTWFLLLALRDQLSVKRRVSNHLKQNARTLTSSHLARVVSSETRAGTSLLLLVPVLLASYSGEGMGLVTSLTLGLGSFGLSGKAHESVSHFGRAKE